MRAKSATTVWFPNCQIFIQILFEIADAREKTIFISSFNSEYIQNYFKKWHTFFRRKNDSVGNTSMAKCWLQLDAAGTGMVPVVR